MFKAMMKALLLTAVCSVSVSMLAQSTLRVRSVEL
jgi:hypothetical protein